MGDFFPFMSGVSAQGEVMSRFKHLGSAPAQAMWPLLALASAKVDQTPQVNGNSLRLDVAASSFLDIRLDDNGLQFRLIDAGGELLHEATVAAWEDQYSKAFWFPFGPFEELEVPEAHRDPIDADEIVARAIDLLNRVKFYAQEPIIASTGREAAAIDYLRLASGVTGRWVIAMAAPHELILDDPYRRRPWPAALLRGASSRPCRAWRMRPRSAGAWHRHQQMVDAPRDVFVRQ